MRQLTVFMTDSLHILTEQQALAEELSALSLRQAELVRSGAAEAILELLEARQRIMDRILANQVRLAAAETALANGPAATADADGGRTRCGRCHGESAAEKILPGSVLGLFLAIDRSVVFPRRDIEQARSRTERWGIPIGSTLIARICGRAGRLRSL